MNFCVNTWLDDWDPVFVFLHKPLRLHSAAWNPVYPVSPQPFTYSLKKFGNDLQLKREKDQNNVKILHDLNVGIEEFNGSTTHERRVFYSRSGYFNAAVFCCTFWKSYSLEGGDLGVTQDYGRLTVGGQSSCPWRSEFRRTFKDSKLDLIYSYFSGSRSDLRRTFHLRCHCFCSPRCLLVSPVWWEVHVISFRKRWWVHEQVCDLHPSICLIVFLSREHWNQQCFILTLKGSSEEGTLQEGDQAGCIHPTAAWTQVHLSVIHLKQAWTFHYLCVDVTTWQLCSCCEIKGGNSQILSNWFSHLSHSLNILEVKYLDTKQTE